MTPLQLDHVTLTYPDGGARLTAVDDASFTVQRGEAVALVGPSGSGKSSVLALAATLIRPDTGRVIVEDSDVTDLSERERTIVRRDRIGIVFQQPNLLDSLTALEQLTVMASIAGTSPRASVDHARSLLEAVDMESFAQRRPAQLSGGQRQRVNIARALMGSPAVLLVDEPTSALDHDKGAEIMTLLRQVTIELDLATIVVTHDTGHLSLDDRVLECDDGRVRAQDRSVLPRPHAASR